MSTDEEAHEAAGHVRDAERALERAHMLSSPRSWTDTLERIKAELEQLRADMERDF